jgi:nitroreductase
VYYTFLARGFRREQRAAFAGKKDHLGAVGVDPVRFTLRRNIHRLEKALIMRPRRPTFARDYIGETVEAYRTVLRSDQAEPVRAPELKWFGDVLTQYFATVEGDAALLAWKRQFDELDTGRDGEPTSAPYERAVLESQPCAVSYADLFELFRRRRSTRWFQDRPVPRELIDQAIVAALQAPSACNRQPFEFRVLDDPALRQTVARLPAGTAGFADNLPVVIVVVGKLNAYFDERDRHVIYIDGALASMSLMLALVTLGLASCPINWPDVEARERAMEQALGLRPWERPIMLIGVGYADPTGGIPFSEKSALEVMRRYN